MVLHTQAQAAGERWLGMEYGEAMASARPFRILLTRPGQRCLGVGRPRVVGQRQEEGGLCLIFAYPESERLPRREA